MALAACAAPLRVVDRAADGTAILICGPQPDAATLRDLHRREGLKTVVNLRGAAEDIGWFEEERLGIEDIGARWIQLRLSRPPARDQIGRIFDLLERPDAWPVFVHGFLGTGSAAVVGALYRMQYQGWTGEDALREMRSYGFSGPAELERFVLEYRTEPWREIAR